MMDFLLKPWHWSLSGFMIVVVMFLLLFLGKQFGVSSSFRGLCSIALNKSKIEYFKVDLASFTWLFLFIIGSMIGGYIATNFLSNGEPVVLSNETISDLQNLGISAPSQGLLPNDLFNFDFLFTMQGFILFIVGGFLIGFGTRWANGCTSGHAIAGLSNFQLPSLIAVIGFFIGGLFTTYFLFPIIFQGL